MKMSKVKEILLIVLILGGIFATWSIGIDRVSNFVNGARDLQAQNAVAECVAYSAPHAIVVEGKIYCYMIYGGSEQMIPLDKLKEMYPAPSPSNS